MHIICNYEPRNFIFVPFVSFCGYIKNGDWLDHECTAIHILYDSGNIRRVEQVFKGPDHVQGISKTGYKYLFVGKFKLSIF